MLRFCDTLVTVKSPVRQVPGCGSAIVERFPRETVLGGFVHEKIDKASPHGGRIVCVCYGGGVLALARGNVRCPRCKSEALPTSSDGGIYLILGNDKQHERLYECQNPKCYYSFNENEDHTFVGDSCKKTCECGYTKTVHNYVLQNYKAATCTEDGYTGDMICTVCSDVKSKGEVIKAAGHQYVLQDDAKPATCTEAGHTASKICSVCKDKILGKTTSKLKHTPSSNTADVIWPAAPTLSNGTYTAKVSVTVNCARCSAAFRCPDVTTNLQGTTQATCTEKATVTFKLDTTLGFDTDSWTGRVPVSSTKTYSVGEEPDHTYQVAWNWPDSTDGGDPTASATVTCKNCNFSASAVVSIAKGAYTAPTCSAAGSQEYIATATYNGKQVGTDTKTVSIPKTGHNYGETPEMKWNIVAGSGSTATATFTCINANCGHKEDVNISQIAVVNKTSCTDEDHTVYTATFSFQSKNYEETYTVAHPGTTPGHAYTGKWTWAEDPADGATSL